MNTKELLLAQIQKLLDNKADAIRQAIQSATESRDNETKSSVGDKYETGRAMMQNEIDKNKAQLATLLKQKAELSKIDLQKEHGHAGFGSLIKTNRGNYFISIGIGKINLDKLDWYCISLSSPIGKQLHNKTTGDSFDFQGRTIELVQVC